VCSSDLGKLSVDDCRRGKRMLDAMSHWEYYIDQDPILGSVRDHSEALPGAALAAKRTNKVQLK